jgi:FAD/FMN-containing dehydrogenase
MDYNTLSFVFAHGFGGNDSGSRLLHDLIQSDCFKQEPERLRPLYLLVETQGSNSVDDASKMDTFLTRLFDSETIINGFLAQDERQLKEMWTIRESCNPCVAQAGCVYKFDVSIPIEDYMEVAWEVKRELSVSIKDVDLIACVW